jgi:hypothetical protein
MFLLHHQVLLMVQSASAKLEQTHRKGHAVMNMTEELKRLRDQNPDLAQILDAFSAIDQVYQQSLEAMGLINEELPSVKNSAEVTLSLGSSISTSNQSFHSENS